jgi:predicted DNA-binding transcriptional regulator AlpA
LRDDARVTEKLIGLRGVQQVTGVKRSTVDSWKRRGVLPEPATEIDGDPVWYEADIRTWWEERQQGD